MSDIAEKPDIEILHTKVKKHKSLRKPTILFVHGIGFNKSFWEPTLSHNRNDYNAITYDLEGTGGSSLSQPYTTMEHAAKTLVRVKNRVFRRGKVVLCGHGLGGQIVMRALEVEPQQFSGAVMVGALPLSPTREEVLSVSNTLHDLDDKKSTQYIIDLFENSISPEYDNPKEIKKYLDFHSPHALAHLLFAQITRVDTSLTFAETKVPILLVTGENDTIVTPKALLELSLYKDGAQCVRIPEAAHLSPLEDSETFHRILKGFATRVEEQE